MRRAVLFVAMLVIIMSMTTVCFAKETVNVYNEDDMLAAFELCDNVKLQNNISVYYDGSLIIGGMCIDLNGHRLTICAGNYSPFNYLCFMNGDLNLFGEDRGTTYMLLKYPLAMKNGRFNLTNINIRSRGDGCLLAADNNTSVNLESISQGQPFTVLDVDPEIITDEMFVNMVKTGELPVLSRDGFIFEGWQDRKGNTYTSFKSEISITYSPAFSQATHATVFGEGSPLRIALLFALLIVIIVIAVLYIRKKKQ